MPFQGLPIQCQLVLARFTLQRPFSSARGNIYFQVSHLLQRGYTKDSLITLIHYVLEKYGI